MELNFGKNSTVDTLSPLKNGLKSLKRLGLKHLLDYDKENLVSLVDNCKELNCIQLPFGVVGGNTISELIHLKKDKLKQLEIGMEDTDCWLHSLKDCPNLDSLTIGRMLITKSGFEAISELKNLRKLQLGYYNDNYGKGFKADDQIQILFNGKFKRLKKLCIYGIVDSIDAIFASTAYACPNVQYLELQCITDNRKDFSKNTIIILLSNLPELKQVKIEWLLNPYENHATDNPIFVKTQFEEIVGKCKNGFQVLIGENDDYVQIVREM